MTNPDFERHVDRVKQQTPLGSGGEKSVYPHPDNAGRVVGVYEKEQVPEELINKFYMTKVAHLLFPKNIPDVHMVTTDPPTIERDRVEGETLDAENSPFEAEARVLLNKLDDAGILLDGGINNCMRTKDGTIVFVDDIMPSDHPTLDNWAMLEDAINTRLSEDKRALAHKYLSRIRR
jgi:hypothetical protein